MIHQAFYFDSLVWNWPIAIYLFLVGISAGLTIVTVILKLRISTWESSQNGVLATTAILAPMTIFIGLIILIFHLTKPLEFWSLLIFYNPTSIMSMGVILFQVYMVVLLIWLSLNYHIKISKLVDERFKNFHWINTLLNKLVSVDKELSYFLLLLAVMLGAYTGFLLSALKSYPMLNNPVLPILFLVSSLSAGIATIVLSIQLFFKETVNNAYDHFLHKIERPVIYMEIFILIVFFSGLILGDGQKMVSAITAIGRGFWAQVFWFGIVGIGLILPLLLMKFVYPKLRFQRDTKILIAILTLCGILMLRFFILYAGQMTLA